VSRCDRHVEWVDSAHPVADQRNDLAVDLGEEDVIAAMFSCETVVSGFDQGCVLVIFSVNIRHLPLPNRDIQTFSRLNSYVI